MGYFGYGSVSFDEKADGGKGKVVEEEGAMDTCKFQPADASG